jgi:hypothetical protein
MPLRRNAQHPSPKFSVQVYPMPEHSQATPAGLPRRSHPRQQGDARTKDKKEA